MNLEDHLGDVIRKSRMMTKVSPADAAAAAGLTESELGALEDCGKITKRPNFPALAGQLDLNAVKLERQAAGWLPSEKNLGQWRELRMFTTSGEGMTVNAYLIWDGFTREAAAFDTGWDAKPILKTVEEHKLQLQHLFITHSHHDHVAGIEQIRKTFPPVKLHSSSKHAPADQRNNPGETVQVGNLRVTHRDTPGHAEDGVTYVVSNWPDNTPQVAVVGDAIFAASMGGAPIHGPLAKQKIRENILTLPATTLICPGHGPLTTVGEEQEYNPFF